MESGCVVPLPYEAGGDGGTETNYPPIIVGATPPMPGPLTILVNAHETYTLDIKDSDQADTLYVRIFRNYGDDPRPVLELTVPPGGDTVRRLNFSNGAFCFGAEGSVTLFFEVVAADRAWLSAEVSPPYQAVPLGAEKSSRTWIGVCEGS